MAAVTITLVGSGSKTFTPGIMADLCRTEGLAGSTLRLYDIDVEASRQMEALGRHMAQASGADVQLAVVDSLESALADADFVITTVAVGGLDAWRRDLEIPAKYSILQPVGDSVGPGGLSRALRVIPVVLGVAEEMESACPDAVLINYTNPMTAICYAVATNTTTPILGLCHGILGTARILAGVLDVHVEEVNVLAGGVNHFTWITELRRAGEDLYPLLDERAMAADDRPSPLSFALWRLYGAFPSPGDRHVAEFMPFFCRAGDDGKLPYGLFPLPIDDYIKNKDDRSARLKAVAETGEGVADLMGPSGEQAVEIIDCLANGRARLFDAVNVPNQGAIAGLPDDAVVEAPAAVGPVGIKPFSPGALPAGVMPFLSARCHQVRLVADAALYGDRDCALQALLADPMVTEFDRAGPMLDELIAAHAEHLPQFG